MLLAPEDASVIVLAALRDPSVQAELLELQVKALIEAHRRMAAMSAGLTDQAMADRLGVHVRTLRRRAKESPELAALATRQGPRASRWPADVVETWWKANPAR